MDKVKIGRNDPCPCGSGRKYKNCCLLLEGSEGGIGIPFDRYNSLMASLKLKLDKYYEAQIRRIRKPMQEKFMRLSCNPILPREEESFFSDWLWFDMTDSEGMTFGREYIKDHDGFIEAPLRECLAALNISYLSIYEIENVTGNLLYLKDYLCGTNYSVILKEPLDLDLPQSPLLMGRLVALPDGNVFSGMVAMLMNDKGQGEFIKQHIDYWLQIQPGALIEDLRKQHGEVIFGLFDHASHKMTLPVNDIRYLPAGVSAKALTQELQRIQAFEPVHKTEGISWHDMKESLGPARLGIHDDGYMVFYADVVKDIIKADLVLEFKKEGWKNVNSLLRFGPPEQDQSDIWYSVIKEREAERWLQTPHEELENRTPAEVLQETGGRDRILSMLDSFTERTSLNDHSRDLIDYMRARVNPED